MRSLKEHESHPSPSSFRRTLPGLMMCNDQWLWWHNMLIPTSCPAHSSQKSLHSLTSLPAFGAAFHMERMPAAGKRHAGTGRIAWRLLGWAGNDDPPEGSCTSDEAKLAEDCRSEHHMYYNLHTVVGPFSAFPRIGSPELAESRSGRQGTAKAATVGHVQGLLRSKVYYLSEHTTR